MQKFEVGKIIKYKNKEGYLKQKDSNEISLGIIVFSEKERFYVKWFYPSHFRGNLFCYTKTSAKLFLISL